MQRTLQRRQILTALAASTLLPGMAWAQGKPLRLVVPFPPGGATDASARALIEPLSRLLGRPVIVDNRAGAGGSVGMAEAARAAPDGAVMAVATLSTHGVNPAVYKKLPYDPIKDFVGVTEIVKAPGILVINPTQVPGVNNFNEFVAYLKANPGKLSYASPGNGTIGHLWGELFKRATGTSMVHVPYRGSGPALNDVLAGQVAAYFDQVIAALPHVKSGKLRALAVSWNERLDVLPNVPTYAELGQASINEPSWFGLVAPAATPPAIVLQVQQAVAKALQDPEVRERLAGLGLFASGTAPADFSAQIRREIAKFKQVAETAHIELD